VGASSTAADEVHDFQAVAIVQNRGGPAVAGDYVTVQFYGYAIGLHAEEIYQGGEGEGSGRVERAFFAVDVKFHRLWIPVVR
jgi:hypothetical protein